MLIRKIHHLAYRCRGAKETVEWYEKHLGMQRILAIAEVKGDMIKEWSRTKKAPRHARWMHDDSMSGRGAAQ